jgi:hypothetical protein
MNGQGHMKEYHTSLNNVCNELGIKHRVAYYNSDLVQDLPSNWQNCLEIGNLEKSLAEILKTQNLASIFKEILNLTKSIYRYIKKNLTKNEISIIFIDRFNALQILSFALSMIRIRFSDSRKNIKFLIMYRGVYRKMQLYYYLVDFFMKFIFPKNSIIFLTDSQKLKEYLDLFFYKGNHKLLPIPHTFRLTESKKNDNLQKKTTVWWPGTPREDKGLVFIQKLSNQLSNYKGDLKIQLLLSSQSKILEKSGDFSIKTLSPSLSHEDYRYYFTITDFILLPYDSLRYSHSTSGIFVEAVTAGVLPLVSSNTWMSEELKLFNLTELIIQWEIFEFIEKLNCIRNNLTILEKFKSMSDHYNSFHSLNNFKVEFANILENF